MHLIEQAFLGLYPDKLWPYTATLKYSGHFNAYNGKVTLRRDHLLFSLSREWRTVSVEIQVGFIQSLLVKLFGKGESTMNIDLYHSFLKSVHVAAPKTEQDPILLASFERLNSQYFNGMMDAPNLVWGSGRRKLGSYTYGSDTIMITERLRERQDLVDYVMYHEMLHKKHKFKSSTFKSFHHTKAFKEDELKFPRATAMDKEIAAFLRKKRFLRIF
ncbi:MAG: hypothetical protein V1735_07590 [Nanoarchaeota archaeon]